MKNGFTLLEVIIAMAIMTIALGTILTVQSGSINASIRTKQMNTVAMLARKKMISLEQDVEGKTFEEVKKEDSGQFEAPYQDFSWSMKIKEVEFPNLTAGGNSSNSGGSEGGGSEGAELMTKLVTKFLSKSLREIELKVLWGGTAERKQSFSLSTYWVDLNHEFETTP